MILNDLIPYIDFSCYLHLLNLKNDELCVIDLISECIDEDCVLHKELVPDVFKNKEVVHIFPNSSHHLEIVLR